MLPRLAQSSGAAALHMTVASAPLFSRVPVLLSPAVPVLQGHPLLSPRLRGSRLRAAFGRGGLASARALLWPGDLPAPASGGPQVLLLPPVAPPPVDDHPTMGTVPRTIQDGDSGYVAVLGSFEDEQALSALVETWRWAGSAMGVGWALRVACPPVDLPLFTARLETLRAAAGLPGALLAEPIAGPQALLALLAGAGAALHLGPLSPWGDALLYSLAAGCPLAAEETWGVDARVGPAAYLAPPGDWRTLGAAILTLLVEANVAEQVSPAARERAAGWDRLAFSERLGEIYAAIRGA
jgi:hypothetical protein